MLERRIRHDNYSSVSLCEVLDRVLHKGVVVYGDIVVSVADVDLIYVGLRLLVASVETVRKTEDGIHRKRKSGISSAE